MKEFKGNQNSNAQRCIIVDMDGTLAGIEHRNPYDASTSHLDELNQVPAEIIDKFKSDTAIVIVTGRKASYSSPTLEWLEKHGITYQVMYMRSAEDSRKDSVIKKEILEQKIKPAYKEILFVLDDRNQVVDMWRKEGLICLQVAEGDF